jgi:hypothetical protein
MQGLIPSQLDLPLNLDKKDWFREKSVLHVTVPAEPGAVLFNALGTATREQVSMQSFVMLLWMFFFVGGEFQLITYLDKSFPHPTDYHVFTSFIIACTNVMVPKLVHLLSNTFEVSETEGERISKVMYTRWRHVIRLCNGSVTALSRLSHGSLSLTRRCTTRSASSAGSTQPSSSTRSPASATRSRPTR